VYAARRQGPLERGCRRRAVSSQARPIELDRRDDLVGSVQRETFAIRTLEDDFMDVHRVGVGGLYISQTSVTPRAGFSVTASIHLRSVRLELTKSGRRREIPMNDDWYRPWSAWIRRLAVESSARYIQTASNNAIGAAKLDDVNFHTLRHTFASWAVMRGVTLRSCRSFSATPHWP
jgi:hypothetical protein